MSKPERMIELASELLRQRLSQGNQLQRRRRKRQRRLLKRILKGGIVMVVITFVVVPAMIASGFLFGPNGTEGLIAAPLVLLCAWAIVLYWTFGKRRSLPRANTKSALPQLPSQTEEWIEQERTRLPSAAQAPLDAITLQLEALTPQLEALEANSPGAVELHRLLAEELPELVRTYRKVPPALTKQPLYGGASPERQLVEGLQTIQQQVERVHERLAAADMHALATHKRYLELKYKPEDDER